MNELYLEALNLDAYRALDMAVFIKDSNSRYLWANDFFVANSGCHLSSDIVNKQDHHFVWHEFADQLQANDKLIFEARQSLNVYERILRYEAGYVNIITKKTPIFDRNKKLVGLMDVSLELPASAHINMLSKREYACALLVTKGYSNKQIAIELKISPRTVETHIEHAKCKLGVKRRAELIAKICQHP